MSNKIYKNDWDRRIVDFDKVHGDSSGAYLELLKSLDLRGDLRIGDIMCGYGEVSSHLLEESRKRGISLDLSLLDSSSVQLDNSVKYLQKYRQDKNKILLILGDARSHKFPMSSLDLIIIKMGLHEVPFEDQRKILRNSAASLKQGGRLYVWESLGLDCEVNAYFKEIVRKKDELAGFKQMVRDRYFPNQEEIISLMEEAGFSAIQEIYAGDIQINPAYLVDLNQNPKKIAKFNSYVRALLPEGIKDKVHFQDNGNSVQMTFTKKIFVGVKK
ncbi:hypothetical protein A3K73_01475 [Candidatus Pacearchaeota archaeon RBG_13_36_9]|nr:MAG: hypothetical protein A3K73_01475 [Candidatus Pacearchaeota archaeon RBG_13_36_9]